MRNLIFAMLFSVNFTFLSFSSVYIVFPVAFFYLILIVSKIKASFYSEKEIFLWLFVFAWVLYLILNNTLNNNFIFKGAFWWFFLLLFPWLNKLSDFSSIFVLYLKLSVVLLFFDVLFRFQFFMEAIDANNFYVLKKNSILGVDSNVAGLIGLVNISLILGLSRDGLKFKFILFLLSLLCFLSFSRAAIFSLVFLYLYHFSKRSLKFFIIPFSFLLFLFIAVSDASGLTKFDLFSQSYEMFARSNLSEILWGRGLGSVYFDNGLTPHILLFQILLYLGVFGLFLYFMIWWQILRFGFFMGVRLFIPYLICSVSFSPLVFPALIFSMLCLINQKKLKL